MKARAKDSPGATERRGCGLSLFLSNRVIQGCAGQHAVLMLLHSVCSNASGQKPQAGHPDATCVDAGAMEINGPAPSRGHESHSRGRSRASGWWQGQLAHRHTHLVQSLAGEPG